MLEKIISGGQTGADQGGLIAAKRLGLATGGYMPKYWLTENGPMPELEWEFGLIQWSSPGYPARTKANVDYADATFIFGNPNSSGSKLTIKIAQWGYKPIMTHIWKPGEPIRPDPIFQDWLVTYRVKVLNVAGNRESKMPGIKEATIDYLVLNLGNKTNAKI